MSRFVPYIKNLVSQLNLDLSDKVIITELATNAYFDAALIPLFAGAKKVIYVDNNVSQENRAHTKKKLKEIIELNAITSEVSIREFRPLPEDLMEVNILCNTGALRPLSFNLLQHVNPCNVVIQLMYDSWEVREEDIDFDYCRSRGIPIVGTSESNLSFDIFYNVAPLIIKMCLEVSRVYSENIFIFSDDKFGEQTRKALGKLNPKSLIQTTDINVLKEEIKNVDLLVLCSFKEERLLLGQHGILNFIADNPNVKLVHLFGIVDAHYVKSTLNLNVYPDYDGKTRKMSKTFAYIGVEPVIDLFLASYKAGCSFLNNEKSEFIQEVNLL
jgi:hypothetical protein